MTMLSEHFKKERLVQRLRTSQLAALAGYKNIGKGSNRISVFETTGYIAPMLLMKFAVALGIDAATVADLVAQDETKVLTDWDRWANETVEPYIVVRLIPAVYRSEPIPQSVGSLEEAEVFAASRAEHWAKKVCLVVSRRYCLWLDEGGVVYARTETVPGSPSGPGMSLGRRRRGQFVRTLSAEEFSQRVVWKWKNHRTAN